MKKLLITFILFSSVITAFAQNKAVIRLMDENTVDGEQIFLKDIAQFSADDETAKKLREISLGFAPNIGMKREIFRDTITLGIIAAGFSVNDFTLQSSSKIIVYRSSQLLDQASMREAVEKAVAANFRSEKVEINITKLLLPEKILLPKGNVEVLAAPMSGVRNFLAPFSVLLEIKVDGKTRQRASANVEIEIFAEVWAMNKNLSANERITESDIHKAKVRLEKPLSYYLSEPDKLQGKKLIKNVAADEPLLLTSIIPDAVIRAGDMVKIVGQSGRMQITVLGEARASGRIGERIPVKNSESGIIFQATVVEEGLVKVKF